MTKSTITREQAQKIIVAADELITALAGTNEDVHPDDSKKMCELWDDLNDRHAPPVVVRELERMALSAMDSEPVAWTDEEELRDANESGSGYLFGIERDANKFADPRRQIMLYRHAQPAPVITFYRDGIEAAAKWLDQQREAYDSEHGWTDPDTGAFEFGNDAQRDYSSTLEELAEGIRALHQNAGNSPVIGIDPASGPDRTVEVRYVAPTGYVMVPKEPTEEMLRASYREASVYSAKAYRAMLAAAPQDTPALDSVQSVVTVSDTWIPVSERMPENDVSVLTFDGMYKRVHHAMYGHWQCWEPEKITHWMPLPAAPQEVK
ncbi:DUF551 domain-containing protein [Klebsiella aerogenes]|uniref:DUF551 domain-containing protein n=1 Tax=Klebsiella aerogenes TaxID=548 RepID=UPI0037BB39A8